MDQVIRLVNNHLREQNFESAIAISKRNIELYPEQPQSYLHTGDAYSFAGNYEKALEYFNQALIKAIALKIVNLEEYETSINKAKKKLK